MFYKKHFIWCSDDNYNFEIVIFDNESKLFRSFKKHQEEKPCVSLLTCGFLFKQNIKSFHHTIFIGAIQKHLPVQQNIYNSYM